AALAEFHIRLSRLFVEAGNADLRFLFAASLKHAQHIAWLRYLPSLDRLDIRKHAFGARLLRSRPRKRFQSLRLSFRAIAFAKERVLQRNCTIVIKRRAPQHRAMRHHAGLNASHLQTMTTRSAASLPRHTKVAGIYKFDVIRVFFQPLRISANGMGRGSSAPRKTGTRMSLPRQFLISRRCFRNARR